MPESNNSTGEKSNFFRPYIPKLKKQCRLHTSSFWYKSTFGISQLMINSENDPNVPKAV